MKSIPVYIIALVLSLVQLSLANTYAFKPLRQMPTNIYAFANKPMKWEKYGVTKETLARILREGTFTNKYMEWVTLRKNLIDKKIDGVFFDADGNGYKWQLIDSEMLHLESSSGRSGFVIFHNIPIAPYLMPCEDNSTTTIKFNQLKVIGFVKDRPVTGPVIAVKKERIEKFLRNGNIMGVDEYKTPFEYKGQITDDSDGKVYERYSNHYYSTEGAITTNSSGNISIKRRSRSVSMHGIYVSGSILTSDRNLYFWDLRDDKHLIIEDENRKGCVLSLE